MERWKQFERWIGRKADFAKFALVILWIIWAMFQVSDLSLPKWERKPLDFEAERAGTQELIVAYDRIQTEADAKGESYGPKDYFADYRQIESERDRIRQKYPNLRYLELDGYGPTSPFNALQQKLQAGLARGKFTNEDISNESQEFVEWKRGGGQEGEAVREKFRTLDLWTKLCVTCSWLFMLYLRTLCLVPLWYLLQMCQRKGILETILADKQKFVGAIFGWPVQIWLYPWNVIREIRVEAELRRLGNLFRRFGEKERALVQKIAASDDYDQWLGSHHRRNRGSFRHGLVLALMATLVVSFTAPAFSSGTIHSGADPPQFQSVGHGDAAQDAGGENVSHPALSHCPTEVFFVRVWLHLCPAEAFAFQSVDRHIEHVPLLGSRVRSELTFTT